MNENLEHEQAFYRKKLDEEKAKEKSTVMTIRLNKEQMAMLEEVQKAINQPKASTAIKTLFYIGCYDVLQDQKTRYIIDTLFKNDRNNERTGAYVGE